MKSGFTSHAVKIL